MKVSAIRSCMVGVSDLERSLQLFQGVMQLRLERRGVLSADELRLYGLPATTRAQYAELSCAGHPVGRLRLVQYSPTPTGYVRIDHAANGRDDADSPTDIGPKAIDFYVADPILPRVAEIERAGYKFRSRPVRHQVGRTESEECLFSGPDGVPILLMVGHRHSDAELRPGCLTGPYSEIATISIVSGDLEASRTFYEDVLGLVLIVDAETGQSHRDSVNDLTGVPPDTRVHFKVYAEHGEASGKVLIVHFYERTGRRLVDRMRPGRLGFSLMSHACDDLDTLAQRLGAGGFAVVAPPTLVRTDHDERRVLLARGPDEELLEFIQAI